MSSTRTRSRLGFLTFLVLLLAFVAGTGGRLAVSAAAGPFTNAGFESGTASWTFVGPDSATVVGTEGPAQFAAYANTPDGDITPAANPNGSLDKMLWGFPADTLFVDLLTNEDGKPFELRMREKTEENGVYAWDSMIAYKNASARPRGYTGTRATGKSCADCHERADRGEGQQYFITLRGGDGSRSFPVMSPGTLDPDPALPIVLR